MTKLRYLPDVVPGYRRVKHGRGFCYLDVRGVRITDARKLQRFRALVIPPAWKNVWISPSKRGHLQVTGIDEDGRKQYLYHPEWTAEKQQEKLMRMVAFGEALPSFRKQIAKDLRRQTFDKVKVIALALRAMEETLMRVGNEQYRRKYGSHGLTTLKKKHLKISGETAVFQFRGKKGVKQKISVDHKDLVEQLILLRNLPRPYLFQYINEEKQVIRLKAADINRYIQNYTNPEFSSKDYRTWYAGLWALRLFAERIDGIGEKDCKPHILSVLDSVSQRLGNTRTVCKQYYVPDRLVSAFEDGSLLPYLENSRAGRNIRTDRAAERQLLAFLRCVTGRSS
ncbi:DNA topoisomerase IB [Parapedobacter defluvii]|uniref:DNA topoisomerase IB n=1 Tax=Parapedobacter defluvii TaxID=2045106 RepID=UPI00166C09CF|nr:DNA topoisomerase IB [Parapedobacter defluvii]